MKAEAFNRATEIKSIIDEISIIEKNP